ncbi:MAG: ATP-binding protein [Ruminiclostridium sp.]
MKKCIAAAAVFILILAAVTALLSLNTGEKQDNSGSLAVTANEIEQLIAKGETAEAGKRAAELKAALSEYAPEKEDKVAYLGAVWLAFGASAVFIAGAFLYIGLRIIRPFEKLSGFAERIAKGDFDLPLNYERENYFGKFTWAFDSMRREIIKARACEKEAVENNKTVIATLSHDIKTPVASIRAYAEGLEAGLDSTPEKRQKYLSVIMSKCDEVARLTDDMFLHSLSDLDKLKMNSERLEFCGFAERAVTEIGEEYGDVIFHKPDFTAFVNCDKNRFTQIFGNIITNARKYAKTDIDVSLALEGKEVCIRFRDYGEGIADEDIPFIFGKFYRGKNCGGEQGSGLGLYIVKYVAEQSGGRVTLKNREKGLEIEIFLPVSESS